MFLNTDLKNNENLHTFKNGYNQKLNNEEQRKIEIEKNSYVQFGGKYIYIAIIESAVDILLKIILKSLCVPVILLCTVLLKRIALIQRDTYAYIILVDFF